MASDPRITQYIREQTGAGFSRQQIYQALLESGWYRQEVEQAFYEVANQNVPMPGPAPEIKPAVAGKKEHHSHKKSWVLLVILAAIALAFLIPVLLPGTFLDMFNPLLLIGWNGAVTGFGELGMPSAWQYSYDGSFSIAIKNNADGAITINSITANCGSGGAEVALETMNLMHLEPGGSITYSTGNEKCALMEPGESYSVSVVVRYLQEDVVKTASGTVTGRIEG